MKRDYRSEIESLIEACKDRACAGDKPEEAGRRALHEKMQAFVRDLSPQDFLKWVEEDRKYSFFYYDVQQDGFCAKPAEVAAMILERIILDHLESN
jgi:hypothetical protein